MSLTKVISEFVKKNKVAVIIGAIVLTLIAIYILTKKRENFGGESLVGMTLGSISGLICTMILPCCCWIFIMYFITKKAAAAAISESENK